MRRANFTFVKKLSGHEVFRGRSKDSLIIPASRASARSINTEDVNEDLWLYWIRLHCNVSKSDGSEEGIVASVACQPVVDLEKGFL